MLRAFLYGDLLFETILGKGGDIPHISRHFRRLAKSAQLLKFDLCGLNEEKFREVLNQSQQKFIASHPMASHQRIRFTLYRNSEGYYLPHSNETQYEVSIEPFPQENPIQTWKAGIFTEHQKAAGYLGNIKSGNALVYVLAKIWAQENHFNEALITNTAGETIEASSSNIFWKNAQGWFTPPLSSGCVAGIGREIFMEQHLVQEKACFLFDLKKADKIVLTNSLIPERELILD